MNKLQTKQKLIDSEVTTHEDQHKSVQKCIIQLSNQLNQLAIDIRKMEKMKNCEKRFQQVPCQVITLNTISRNLKEKQIEKWLGNSCRDIFSIGFSLFQSGELDHKKVNSFCSENLLRHILILSQSNPMQTYDFSFINQILKNKLLPYFLQKYPLSEQSQTSIGFSRKVVEKDNKLKNENDLLYRSKVKFQWREGQNYNDRIMQFFNFLLELPQTSISQKRGSEKQNINEKQKAKKNPEDQQQNQTKFKLSDLFFKDMENIFGLVQNQDQMLEMKRYDPKEQNKNINKNDEKQSKIDRKKLKQEQKYRQKVKQYTDYKIGRKLSQNIPKFTQNQIKSLNLNLSNSALMRVATKWCEELSECFSEDFIIKREQQFRMRDGSTKFMKRDQMLILSKLLAKEKKKIDEKQKQLMANNIQSQTEFSKMELNDNFIGYLKQEASVGQFSCQIFKNNQSYLQIHLNNLIHGILTATKEFEKFIKVERRGLIEIQGGLSRLQDYLNDIEQLVKDLNDCKIDDQCDVSDQIPQLISFLIGDLLRCKCSSQESQIIALYNEIQRISQDPQGILHVVRIKNRLGQNTKDILMNIMYRDTLVIEMQLAIKSNKSKFIDCSTHFNHYIYELKRAQFGPISQLSSIWVNLDLRSKFYLDKIEEINQAESKNKKAIDKCCTQADIQPIKLPFRCSICTIYYSQCNYIQNHIKCNRCNSKVCLKCRIDGLNYKEVKKILKFLPKIDTTIQPQISKKQIPSQGLLVNLRSQQKKHYFFKKIEKEKKSYFFIKKDKDFEILNILKNKQKKTFLMNHFIVSCPNFKKSIPQISELKANHQFFIPEYLQKCAHIEKDSIVIVKEGLKDKMFGKIKDNVKWPKTSKINFSQNELKTVDFLCEKFSNVETAVLNENQIVQIGPSLKQWKKLTEIYLRQNLIRHIDPAIGQCKSLMTIELSTNKLTQLPDTITQLTKLKRLSVNRNQLTKLPQKIQSLTSLKILEANYNKIATLPKKITQLTSLTTLSLTDNQISTLPKNIGLLTTLTYLNIDKNKIKTLPDSIGNLSNLIQFHANSNKLSGLPESIQNMKSLNTLILYENQLKSLPSAIGNLSKLTSLDLNNNQLHKLPDSIGNLSRLTSLNLTSNKLTEIPESFGNLSALLYLYLNINQLKELPERVKNLTYLTHLNLSTNHLTELPEHFDRLKSLKSLDISHNKITPLPMTIFCLSSLETLDISDNFVQTIPTNIDNLYSLNYLHSQKNLLEDLPDQIGELSCLRELYLSNNKLLSLPKTIQKLKNLQLLDLKDNNFKTKPKIVQKMEGLYVQI